MANLSLPGNPRYQPKDLQQVFGYDNLYRALAEVEIATMRTLADIGVIPKDDIATLTPQIEAQLMAISTTEVDKVEREVTKHDVRAWVRLAQNVVDPCLRRWIHVPLTSYDALDTARALQFRRGHDVVRALTDRLIGHFATQVERYAGTIQIGRTHGQHALPITVGFWLAGILSRILSAIESANWAAMGLVGKISGAVGAYNAQVGLGLSARAGAENFEALVLAKLGLRSARISTQILPPEPVADYLFSLMKLSAALGQFGRDGRQLMRSEIAEIGEPFEKGQVGSSTMAHKRNPINFENLEGTWQKNQAEFQKVLFTMVSEHQRDLVGSSIMRDFPTIVVNVVNQLTTLLRGPEGKPFILRLSVDEESLERNFTMQGDSILAEPMYIALQMAGYEGDAHDLVNHRALAYAREHNTTLFQAVATLLSTDDAWLRIPTETIELLRSPGSYTGSAARKAKDVAEAAREYLNTGST